MTITVLSVPVENVLDARRRWSLDCCRLHQDFYPNEWTVSCLNDLPVSCCSHAPKI